MDQQRRDFIKFSATNAAMVMAISIPTAIAAKTQTASSQSLAPHKPNRSKLDTWNIYLTINPDNQIEIASPVQDMGQHMKTTGPMLIAEELDADWSLVSCVAGATFLSAGAKAGEVTYTYADMNTGGSHALRTNWDYLRQAGATAKQMLKQAAAETWRCNINEITAKKSFLFRQNTGEKLSFGRVAEIAASLQVPDKPPALKSRSQYSIIGSPVKTVDIDSIVTGRPLFAIDMDYPNQVHVVVARCPYYQGSIRSYDDKMALAVKGVISTLEIKPSMGGTQKLLSAGIAVVASSLWAAMKAKKRLEIEWDKGEWHQESAESLQKGLSQQCQNNKVGRIERNDGDINEGFKQTVKTLQAEYSTPFFHHACMEPFNCIADIRENNATIIVGHQSPEYAATTVAQATGLDPLKVEIQSHRMGGGFGRKWSRDYVTEAAIVSKQLKRPVKVTWTREDEMEQDYFAPMQVINIKAGLDTKNQINTWHYRHGKKSGGAYGHCFPANLIPNYKVEALTEMCGTPVGAWRGPGHLQYTFAVESMIDELAAAAKQDPVQFRRSLFVGKSKFAYKGYGGEYIDAERMWKCYEKVAQMADWNKLRPKHIGVGIAGHFTFGSYTAFVVEVDTQKAPEYRVTKCWGAIDCGLAVNPNHINNQMEGGFIDGLNAAMFNQAEIKNGRVKTSNFDRLSMLRMAQAPADIEVAIMKNNHPPTGVGEPPTAPAAAALANALFAATGQRLRNLPLKLEA